MWATDEVRAEGFLSANVQYLHGSDYADDFGIDDKTKSIITVEVAHGWAYGDNFFFLDISNPAKSGTALYGEFSPRLSLGRIAGADLSFGPIKDILVAGTIEMGDGVHALLIGPGFALNLPGFAFADINLYYRESHRDFVPVQTDSGYQVTIDWLLPFKIAGIGFAFEGFFDYAWGEKGGTAPKADNIITAPRLLVSVGDLVGAEGIPLQAGIEYQIWRNKYGIQDVNEDVVQAMVKWTF